MSSTNISIDKLRKLIGLSSNISKTYTDPDALLTSGLETVMHIIGCEAGSILLYSKERDVLEFVISLGPKKTEIKEIPVKRDSIAGWVFENRKPVVVNEANKDPRFNPNVQQTVKYITRNIIAYPIVIDNEAVGVIEVLNKNSDFNDDDLAMIDLLAEYSVNTYRNAKTFKENAEQIEVLQSQVSEGADYHPFIAKNSSVISLLQNIGEASVTNSSVLITGESGVGKELFAEQVHLKSVRHSKPFVRVSCAALNPTLLESELFGHVKGAFTDAVSNRKGRFELADGGSIFLDEIGELPLNLQSKLLRVIQEKKFERVGSSETVSVDVRIIAATNRDLEAMITEGTFRSDLYFRLNVLPLNIPPLRERKDEIAEFCQFFLQKFRRETHKNFIGFTDEARKAIYSYSWPGNIRELENTIERACIIGKPPYIQVGDLRLSGVVNDTGSSSSVPAMVNTVSLGEDRTLKFALNEFKKQYVTRILDECHWNQTMAAKILGIQRTYVSKLINELGIRS